MPSHNRPRRRAGRRKPKSGGWTVAAALVGGLLIAAAVGVGIVLIMNQDGSAPSVDASPKSGDSQPRGNNPGGLFPNLPDPAPAKPEPRDPPPGFSRVSAADGGFEVFLPDQPKRITFRTNGQIDTNWVGHSTRTATCSIEVKSVQLGPAYTPGVTAEQILIDLKRFNHFGIAETTIDSTTPITMSGRTAVEVRVRKDPTFDKSQHIFCATTDLLRLYTIRFSPRPAGEVDPELVKTVRDSFTLLPTATGMLPAAEDRAPPNYSVLAAPDGGFRVFAPGIHRRQGFQTNGSQDQNWVSFVSRDWSLNFEIISVRFQPPAAPARTPEELLAWLKQFAARLQFDPKGIEGTSTITLDARPGIEVRWREQPRLSGKPGDPFWAEQHKRERERIAREGMVSVFYVTSDDRRLYIFYVRCQKDPPSPAVLKIIRDSFKRI